MKDHLFIGTSKGLIIFRNKNHSWVYDRVEFLGLPISTIHIDERNDRWWVCLAHKHWGQKVHYSDDKGQKWETIPPPKYPKDAEVKNGVPATLRYIWSFANGGTDHSDTLYIGTEPGGLFKSQDNGQSWDLVEALWNHPSRKKHWFGGGRDYAGIHSIIVDPRNSNHIFIGVSCAGVFKSEDGGETWEAKNQGLRADFLPDPYATYGHDPHLLSICSSQPEVIWQQNHCGIFKTNNSGTSWEEVSDIEKGIYYGFTIATNSQNPERAWVIPATSDQMRVAVNFALFVGRTEDGGKTWETLRSGLPQTNCYDIVLRHALAIEGQTLAFGSTTGNVFLSENSGDHWVNLGNHMPTVFVVQFG